MRFSRLLYLTLLLYYRYYVVFGLIIVINMSLQRRRFCIFRCDALDEQGVPLHRFPNPNERSELFAAWVSAAGDKLKEIDPMRIFRNRRICDQHFDHSTKKLGGRIISSAIPTINLHRIQQSIRSIVETEHNYCGRQMRHLQRSALMDITNQVLPGPSSAETFPILSQPIASTCLTVHDKDTTRSIRKKMNAEETFKFLLQKSEATNARKQRQNLNEIRRLRQNIKLAKIRLRQQQKLATQRDFEKLTRHMPESAKLFTRMQFFEGQKKKKGHRFTQEEKVLSLSIYKKSPKAYKLMCKHFTLPSKKVLKTMLASIKLYPGINNLVFQELKETVSKMLPQDRLCTLIFDKMSISPQIQYNVYTDDLVGFENFGDGDKTNRFANHVLVFMVKGVRKNFKQPVAYYFAQTLKTCKLKVILKNVVTNVQATGLNVIATVCDQCSTNVSTINSLIMDAKIAYFNENKEWRNDVIIINNKEIIPLYDTPHLIKGIRNNLLNKELKYVHNNESKTIKWEYFQRVFEADSSHGELRLLPKLTNEHVDPDKIRKMRVKNATQLLSYSMAVATDNLVARKSVPEECGNLIQFVLTIDKLFDTLNAYSFVIQNGKIYRAAVKRYSPHHELWQDAIKLLKSITFIVKKSNGQETVKSVPTVNNLIKTIEGFKALWQLLLNKYSFDAMLTRNFNQDPLENFFGSIRSLGARNVAPNCMGFEGAYKTLLLNNYSSNHSVNSNCEEDSSDCLQSVSFFIKNKHIRAPLQSQNILIDQPLEVVQNSSIADSGADQRIYVCGWALTKCLQRVVKGCKSCKGMLLGNPENLKYRYIRGKEYNKNKKWLCYPSDSLVACFQEIQGTTVSFLNSECYKPNIKERIKAFIDLFTDFNFIDCEEHRDKVKECFVDTTINILIFRWCRSIHRILEGKLTYDGEDVTKKVAQLYYNKYKSKKK